jgi:hypothetical protein
MDMNDSERDYASETKGDSIWDALDDYEKGEIVRWGTSFTTYEDLGAEVCAQIMHRARAWHVTEYAKQQRARGERVT